MEKERVGAAVFCLLVCFFFVTRPIDKAIDLCLRGPAVFSGSFR